MNFSPPNQFGDLAIGSNVDSITSVSVLSWLDYPHFIGAFTLIFDELLES